MLSKTITLVKIVLARILNLLSQAIPRSDKIWVFIGWHTNGKHGVFADNSKYMFLYVADHGKNVKPIWIGEDKDLPARLRKRGYVAYSVNSFWGIYYSLRAGYTFIDAFMKRVNWQYAGGSKVIQLWHGKGMKKTGHDSPYSLKNRSRWLAPNLFTKFHKLIASSDYTAGLMASTFNVASEKILVTGLPRNDVLHYQVAGAEIDSHPSFKKQLERGHSTGASKIIIYAPTFRPDGSNPLKKFEFEKMEKFLQENNYYLIISLHPKFAKLSVLETDNYKRISAIEAGYDIYLFLKEIDVLVTDYSSLYVDFLQLNRPIVFYTYDLEKYKKEMGLHADFKSLTPGPHPKSFDELLEALASSDSHIEERQEVTRVLHQYQDGQSAERIYKLIKSQQLA